jgi:molybdopterin-containing oxidoreductase family membrane subunit
MRYLMIVPVLETPYIPIQDARPEYFNYTATWVEWALTATGIAAFILLFIFAAKIAPIVPVSEMLEEKEEHKLMKFFKVKKKLTTSKL